MATVEELKLRVRELENELIKCKQKQCSSEDAHIQAANRPKIDKMSAEVVDSNPYRSLLTPYFKNLMMDFVLNCCIFRRQRLVSLIHGPQTNLWFFPAAA